MDHEIGQIGAVLASIIDNDNTDRAMANFTANRGWVEVDSLLWHELVHQARIARDNLQRVRVALNEAQQQSLF